MKKLLTIILSLALLSMASVTAFAANPITFEDGSDSADVKGTYVAGSSTAAVYSVDITWGSMEFTYTDASSGVWNPQTHKYDGATATAGWSCEAGANKITVTNHSNVAVTVQLTYNPDIKYSDITGSFTKALLNLKTAEDTEFSNAPSGSAELTLSGGLSSDTSASTKIGTVTVTLGAD